MFGYSYSVVATDSMEPTILIGEIIISKSIPFQDVKQDDIIVFFSEEYKVFIVHRVYEISDNGDLITKGDNPSAPIDESPVTEENFFGVVVRSGKFLNIGTIVLKYRNVVFLLIVSIFLIIIVREILTILKNSNKKKKEESQSRFEAEKRLLVEEQKEKIRQEILDELKKDK